ncbi:MAG: hypothetical protein QXP34_01510 [Candidatus Aenigmatarchaeota archaeon]
MDLKLVLKAFFVGIINFIIFPLFFLLLILYSYELYDCKFFNLDFCKISILFFEESKIYILFTLGILIVIFAVLSNLFTRTMGFLFSMLYSIFIFIFLVLILNFGYLSLPLENIFGIDRVYLKVEYRIIFYLLMFAVVIDIIRKILLYFLEKKSK